MKSPWSVRKVFLFVGLAVALVNLTNQTAQSQDVNPSKASTDKADSGFRATSTRTEPASGDVTSSSASSSTHSSNTAGGQNTTKASKPEKSKVKADLPNFHEVHPYLYRGGEPTEEGLHQLKAMGVGTLIDLRAPSEMKVNEKQIATRLGLNYINLVMDSHAPTKKQVDRMLHEIDTAKEASESGRKNQAVFVHCAHGSDRTGCMVGIWRVTREHWSYPETYQEMRKYYFTPKFTKLSGAVEEYAKSAL
ncbi:MAG TPA: tyrosine-protein phosphatase [Oculatellaceae cyanobacterium]